MVDRVRVMYTNSFIIDSVYTIGVSYMYTGEW